MMPSVARRGIGLRLLLAAFAAIATPSITDAADGSDERRGVTPDRWVPWAPSDSAHQRAIKATEAVRHMATTLPRS